MSTQIDWGKAFTDFDGWRASLDTEQKAAIDERFRYSNNPEEDRKRFLAVGYVADQTGHDVTEVSQNFETLFMPQFAKHPDGLAMPQLPRDINEFYSAAQTTVKHQAFASEAAKTGADAALAGTPRLQALREWQSKAQAQVGYAPTATTKFLAGYDELNTTLDPYRGKIGSAVEAMRRKMDGKGSPEDDARLEPAANEMADMTPEERRVVAASFARSVKKHGEEAKASKGIDYVPGSGLLQESGEAAARTFDDMFGTMADTRDRSIARKLDVAGEFQTSLGAISNADDAKKFVAEQIGQARMQRLSESGYPAATDQLEKAPARKLTPEEQALVKDAQTRAERVFSAVDDIRDMSRAVDPIREGWLSVGAAGLGSSAALLIPGILGPQGAVLSMAGYTNTEANKLRRDLILMRSTSFAAWKTRAWHGCAAGWWINSPMNTASCRPFTPGFVG